MYLLYKICSFSCVFFCFWKWKKSKDPKSLRSEVFWQVPKLQSASEYNKTSTTTTTKTKCLVFRSVCIYCPFYSSHCAALTRFHSGLVVTASRFVSIFLRKVEAMGRSVEGGGSAVSTMCRPVTHPDLLPPHLPLMSGQCSWQADQEMWTRVAGEEEVGSARLLWVKAHLLCPSGSEQRGRRQRPTRKERERITKRWAVTKAIVWLDCFGPSWGTDWGCSFLGGHRWPCCLQPRFPDPLSSPASPGWEVAWSRGSPSSAL